MGVFQYIEPLEPRRFLATSGLTGIYFNNSDFTGSTTSRNDKTIAFTWRGASPATNISGTTFSVRWHGVVKPYTTENHTFITRNNDGVRLWVDGKLLIDSWKSQPTTTRSATIALKQNRLYDIRVEHFADSGGSQTMQLTWDTPTRASGYIPSTRQFTYDTRGANVSDYGWDNSREADVAKMIKRWAPDYITTNGDNNQLDVGGGWSNFDRVVGKYYREYIGNYKGSYGTGSSTNRFFPAMGNHDWDDGGWPVHRDYFTLPNNERYYDLRKGPIHYFIVSSDPREPGGTSATSSQAQWIKSKMQASTAPFKVVIMHHPPYASSDFAETPGMRWPLRSWGADVVLSGHEHAYERLSVDGIPYIVNGAGGTLTSFDATDSHSVLRNNADVGAMLISANEYVMTLQFQHRSGRVIDSITIGPSPAGTTSATAAQRADPIATSSFDFFSATATFYGPLPIWSSTPIDGDDA